MRYVVVTRNPDGTDHTSRVGADHVAGWVLGLAAAAGRHDLKVVDGPLPERDRQMQLLRAAQDLGLCRYVGVEPDSDDHEPEG